MLSSLRHFLPSLKAARCLSVLELAERILPKVPAQHELKDVLELVWNDEDVYAQAPGLLIRLASIRGQVARTLWEQLGNDPEEVQILAIGSVAVPEHLPKFHEALKYFFDKTAEFSLAATNPIEKTEIGYDLLAVGNPEVRKMVLELFNKHYGFPEDALNAMALASAPSAGGVRALRDICSSMIDNALDAGQIHRFIHPDNSFGTYFNCCEATSSSPDKELRREIISIQTQPGNKLHLGPEDVVEFYKTHEPRDFESWYITPVGNPSGTKMTGPQLTGVVEKIVEHNPKAIVIIDSVYIRTLLPEVSKDMYDGVANNRELLDHCMFLESFSKSHGICGERLGFYFTSNPALFPKIHRNTLGYSAGSGRHKDHQMRALASIPDDLMEGVSEMHEFWRKERKGLLAFLNRGEFSDLWDADQSHTVAADYDSPCGLYVTMRCAEGVTSRDVFIRTGKLGVDQPLAGGNYVRFSIGLVTKPTFEAFLEE